MFDSWMALGMKQFWKYSFDAKFFTCLIKNYVFEFCSTVTKDCYTASFASEYAW